jgi:hypothetical protein
MKHEGLLKGLAELAAEMFGVYKRSSDKCYLDEVYRFKGVFGDVCDWHDLYDESREVELLWNTTLKAAGAKGDVLFDVR